MCMLFIKPQGLALPRAYFDSLHDINADGVSFYNFTTKDLVKTLDYEEAFKYLQDNAKHKLIVHFRFGTSGKATLEQLHGWDIIGGRYHFFHNGVLSTFDGTKEQSDTQQLVSVINQTDLSLDRLITFLETFEYSSRFIILDKETQEIIIPNCAKWNEVININGCPVQFSNDYAVAKSLQVDDGHLIEFKPRKPYTGAFTSNWDKHDLTVLSHNDFYFDDELGENELDPDTLLEIEHAINNLSFKDLLDLIMTNPHDIAKYLKEYA